MRNILLVILTFFAFSAQAQTTTCDQIKNACAETSLQAVEENLAKTGFEPDTAAISAPEVFCERISANAYALKYHYPYVIFGDIVQFKMNVETLLVDRLCRVKQVEQIWPQ